MPYLLRPLLASLALLGSASVFAHVTASNAWTRATVPQQQASGVFMDLRSAHDDAKLVGVRSDAAASTEIHEMRMEDNVMKMRKVEPGVAIQPGKPLELKPGGYHVMLMDLPAAMTAGAHVPLTLVFKDAAGKESTVDVHAMVRALNANAPAAMDHGKHKH